MRRLPERGTLISVCAATGKRYSSTRSKSPDSENPEWPLG
jgi:hypothetical protein